MRFGTIVAIGLICVATPHRLARCQAASPSTTIAGRSVDSLAGQRPLVGASIQLASTDPAAAGKVFAATSDSAGKFSLTNVPPGRYLLGFYHPTVDSLGIELSPRAVDIREGTQELVVATPSASTLAATLCGQYATAATPGILLGHLHDAQTETGIVGGRVSITWSEPTVANGKVVVGERVAETNTRADGWFFVCGLPAARDLAVVAVRSADSAAQSIRLEKGFPLAHLSVYVGAARAGTARVSGRVVDESHRPIRAARIKVDVSDSETVSSMDGTFAIDRLPAGTHVISVRAIGFSPRDSAIKLDDGAAVTMEVALAKPVMLSAVVTNATATEKNAAAFEDHKRHAVGGYFAQPTRLEGQPALQNIRTLVSGAPRLRISRTGEVTMPGLKRNTFCAPMIFVNGKKALVDSVSEISALIDPDDVIGVEVYTRQSEIPLIYERPANNPCGVVAVWTKVATPSP